MKRLMQCLFCLFLLKTANAQDSVTLRIDPDYANGGYMGQLADTVEFFPLETTKESLFGDIHKLIVTDKFFFIWDRDINAILVFNKEGKLYSKIDLTKILKSSATIRYFTVNEKKRLIVISDWAVQDRLSVFNFEGKLVNIIKDKSWSSFVCIDASHYLMEANGDIQSASGDQSGNCVIIDGQFQYIEKYLLKYRPSKLVLANSITNVLHGNSLFYSRPYDNIVYSIDKSGINQFYKFIFPLHNSLPHGYTAGSMTPVQEDSLRKNNTATIWSISDFYRIGDKIIFRLNTMEANFMNRKTAFLYDLTSGSLLSLDHFTPDSSSSFMPITKDWGGAVDFLSADENSFYVSLPSYLLFQYYTFNKDKHPVYSANMEHFFKTQNNKSNPVIMRIKLKNKL